MARRWIDLTQPLFTGMPHGSRHGVPTFEPRTHPIAFPGGQSLTSTTEISMAAHVGTHIDAARHFFPDGHSIDEYPYERFVGPGVVLDMRREGPIPINAEELQRAAPAIDRGDIVFLYCGYAERFGQEAYRHHPYLSQDAGEFLVERGVSIVGTDTVTPDLPVPHRDKGFVHVIHRHLLRHDVLIVENLGPGLRLALGRRLTLAAIPLRIIGADGAPIAAFALLED
jgi:kynurenine formamidase